MKMPKIAWVFLLITLSGSAISIVVDLSCLINDSVLLTHIGTTCSPNLLPNVKECINSRNDKLSLGSTIDKKSTDGDWALCRLDSLVSRDLKRLVAHLVKGYLKDAPSTAHYQQFLDLKNASVAEAFAKSALFNVHYTVMALWSSGSLQTICGHLTADVSNELTRRFLNYGATYTTAIQFYRNCGLNRTGTTSVRGVQGFSVASAVIDTLHGSYGSASSWTQDVWDQAKFCIIAWTSAEITALKKEYFTTVTHDALLFGLEEWMPTNIIAFFDMLNREYPINNWRVDQLREFSYAIPYMPAKFLPNLQQSLVVAGVINLPVDKITKQELQYFMNAVRTIYTSQPTPQAKLVAQAVDYWVTQYNSVSAVITDNIILSMLDDIPHPLPSSKATIIWKKIKTNTAYSDTGSYDAARLKLVSTILSAMSVSDMKKISSVAMETGLTDLAELELSPRQARVITDKLISSYSQVVGTRIEKFQRLVVGILPSNVEQVTVSNLPYLIGRFERVSDLATDGQVAVMDEKLKNFAPPIIFKGLFIQYAHDIPNIVRRLSLEHLRPISCGDIKLTGKDIFRFDCGRPDTCQELWLKAKECFGAMSDTNINYSSESLANIRYLVCGFTCDDIAAIPLGLFPAASDTANRFCNIQRMSEAQELCWASRGYSFWSYLTKSVIHEAGRSLKYYSVEELKMPASQFTCIDVVIGMGRHDSDLIQMTHVLTLQNLTTFALECINRKTSGSIRYSDVSIFGDLICGLDEKSADRLDQSVLEAFLPRFGSCPLTWKTCQALLTKVKATYNINFKTVTSAELVTSGLLRCANRTDIYDIPQTNLCDGIDHIRYYAEEYHKTMKARTKAGLFIDITREDQDNFESAINYIFSRCFESQSGVSCDMIIRAGPIGTAALTSNQISSLSATDFDECAEILGSVTSYTDGQKSALAQVAIKSWGAVSTWSKENLLISGVIGQGLSDPLTSVDTDVMSYIGQYSGWSESKRDAIYSNWLKASNINSELSGIKVAQIVSLGQFACSLPVDKIKNIPHSTLSFTFHKLGTIACLSTGQKQELVKKAKQTFGADTTTWSPATVAIIGNIIGGLSKEELSKLTKLQVNSISPAALRSVESLNAFTTSQLNIFSPSQTRSIKGSQYQSLSETKKDILNKKGYVIYDIDIVIGGVQTVGVQINILLLSMVFFVMVQF